MKRLGILGGMGPYATVDFMKLVMDHTDATKDWEHIPMIVDCNTQIPSRTRALLYGEEDPCKAMIRSCQMLSVYSDIIAIPCNSAMYWYDKLDINHLMRRPITNIIEITSSVVDQWGYQRALVLSGYIPWKYNLYGKYLGDKCILPSPHDQETIEWLIEEYKQCRIHPSEYLDFVNWAIEEYNMDCIILACTELSSYQYIYHGIPVIDSLEELAKYVVRYCTMEE